MSTIYAVLFSHASGGELRGPFANVRDASTYASTIRQAARVESISMRSRDEGTTWALVFVNTARPWWYSERQGREIRPVSS